MKRTATATAITIASLGWFVNIYSNNSWIHGGYFPTHERCERAKLNLIAQYTSLGYPNVKGYCVFHNDK